MAAVTMTLRVRDLASPIQWEAEWAALNGRPWGWTPPKLPRLDITLDPLYPFLSRVRVGDLDIPAEAVSVGVTAAGRRPSVAIEVPLTMADVRTVPPRG